MRRLVVLALLTVAVAGCGGPPADLFVANRTGSVPGAKLEMLVSDGSVRCNGGKEHEISSAQVLEGRAIATDLETVKQSDIPQEKAGIFAFKVRSEWGTDQVRRPQHEPDRPAAHRASRARSRAQRVRSGALGAAGVGAQRLGQRDRVLHAEPERLAQRIGEVALRARADLVAHPQHVAAGTGAMDLDLLTTLCCRGTRVVGAGHPPNHLRFAARANSDMR